MAIHVSDYLYKDQLPPECIAECSHPGDCDQDVEYWREHLGFTVDPDRARSCLAEYGAWERDELASWDADRLATTVLWIACGNFSEPAPNDSDVFSLVG